MLFRLPARQTTNAVFPAAKTNTLLQWIWIGYDSIYSHHSAPHRRGTGPARGKVRARGKARARGGPGEGRAGEGCGGKRAPARTWASWRRRPASA